MGPDVRSGLPVLSLFRSSLFEPASLAGQPSPPARHPLRATGQCLSPLLRSRSFAETGRFPDGPRLDSLRSEMAGTADALLHRTRTPTSRCSAPVILLASRVL